MRGDGHVKLAAAVEFMHTATLLHDDVVDESDMRRGKLAARMLWGNEASVLVGDFLLGQAFKMMVEVGNLQALEILSSAAAVIAEGEVMQLAAAKNTATTEDEYIAVIRAKTAELFAAACEVGPALAARHKAEQAACRSFGMNLGIAFQLVDDALDYGGKAAKLGKNVGDDFREGKITLPVVLAFRRGGDGEREFWRRTLERGEATDADLEHAIGLMTKHRAIEDTDRARAPLRRHRQRRAGAVPGLADEDGARRDGRVLHRAGALGRRRATERRQRRRAHPPVRDICRCTSRRISRAAGGRKKSARSRSRPSPTCAHSGSRASARKRGEHLGDDRRKRDGRRFQIVRLRLPGIAETVLDLRAAPAPRHRAAPGRGRGLQSGEHVVGRNRDARIDQHRRQAAAVRAAPRAARRCRA